MKRWISLLLVVLMVFALFPAAAFAADGDEPDAAPNVNPRTGREIGPAGNRDVALMVYGESISDAVMKSNYDIDDFWAALKNELQGVLSNEKLPELEVYLVNDQNQEYQLEVSDGRGASMIQSFQLRTGGILAWLDDVYDWVTKFFNWVMGDIPTVGEFYRIYRVDDVPEGDYTLEVRMISEDGYKLWQPENGTTRVHVGDRDMNYIGYEQRLGSHTFEVNVDLWLVDFDIEVWSIDFSMPGVFLRTEQPGITFRSADLGGNALPGTSFVMVNRDETENIVKAAFALGKETFTNAMNLVGTEGFTWEELSILHNDVLQWDKEAAQITLNEENAYKLLQTYWALVSASGMDPMLKFMSADTNIRLPAILKATSDANGAVRFTEDSNVTLIWSMEILLKMGNLILDEFTEQDIDAIHFADKQTESLVKVMYWVGQYALRQGKEYWDADTGTIKSVVNEWIYPVMQNDHLGDYAISLLKLIKGEDFVNEHMDVLKWLPDHAFLTKKMPAGAYIMFETSVPDGYLRSPMFYTIYLEWHTESRNVSDWCYASVGNLGVILPYFAEDYYTFLRNSNAAAKADELLGKFTGNPGTMIQDTLSGSTDMTAMTIAYGAHLIYNSLGGKLVYGSEAELAADLTKYLYAYGRTTQNLLMFASKVAKEAKSVVTSDITPNWTFYNFSTSLRTNIALQVQSLLRGAADSVDTSNDNAITSAVKDVLNEMADNLDTSNRIIEETTALQNELQQAVETAVNNVVKTAASKVASIGKWIIKMATRP